MDGLPRQAVGHVLEGGSELRWEMVSVKDGGAGLEGRGDAFLEGHDGVERME